MIKKNQFVYVETEDEEKKKILLIHLISISFFDPLPPFLLDIFSRTDEFISVHYESATCYFFYIQGDVSGFF